MTQRTEAQRLADELMEAHRGHQDEGPSAFSEAANLLRRQDELLRQALAAMELSLPAPCGQSDELMAQERAAHRSITTAIRNHLEGK